MRRAANALLKRCVVVVFGRKASRCKYYGLLCGVVFTHWQFTPKIAVRCQGTNLSGTNVREAALLHTDRVGSLVLKVCRISVTWRYSGVVTVPGTDE
jgi:hypothetical protein